MHLQLYWVTFSFSAPEERPVGTALGFGVTPESEEAALALVRRDVFNGSPLPGIEVIARDVDVR